MEPEILVVSVSRLTKALETVLHHGNKKKELLALGQPKPNAKLAKLLNRRTIPSKSSANEVPFIVHNEIYASNQQEIADAFGYFFASALRNDINPTTPSLTCLAAESFQTISFPPKDACQLLLKTKIGFQSGPDSLPAGRLSADWKQHLNIVHKQLQFVCSMPHLSVSIENLCDHFSSQNAHTVTLPIFAQLTKTL